MKNFEPEKKLDSCLKYLSELPDLNGKTVLEIENDLGIKPLKEVIEIVGKLKKDGFVWYDYINEKSIDLLTYAPYTSTFEGRIFINNGGYVKQKEINELFDTISTQKEKRTARNEVWLMYGTWFAGIAALFLLLWQILLWYYPQYKDYPYYWIWQTIPKTH